MEKIVGKPKELIKSIWKLNKYKVYTIEIKNYRKKRSLDSNSYAWVLMDKIAEVLGITKEDVYKEFIKEVGQFTILAVKDFDADSIAIDLKKIVICWVTRNVGKSCIPGYLSLMLYYGTSTYTQKDMTRFVNYVVEQAKELDIETLPPYEIERLNSLWKQY